MTIAGVVPDVHHNGLAEDATLSLYKPMVQRPLGNFDLAIRTSTPPATVVPAVRAMMRTNYPDVTAFTAPTMTAILDRDLWARRATAGVIGGFSLVALLLTVVGLYGTISYVIGQRRREIGVRNGPWR